MMKECPYCGANVEIVNGKGKCRYCGYVVTVEPTAPAKEEAYSPKESAPSYNNEAPNTSKTNAASNVYEKNVAGVCIIRNLEDRSSGSGFIYKSSGLVITNAHVIYYDEEDRPSKNLNVIVNGKPYNAHVVASNHPDGDNDIALVQIDSNDFFQELEVGNSKKVQNGEEVIAIGNPKGEGLSITRGIVSDCERHYGDQHYIMSDVTINGGNSGGPLFNEKGEVIAICVSSRLEADNMNFFIPINHVLEFVHRWGY